MKISTGLCVIDFLKIQVEAHYKADGRLNESQTKGDQGVFNRCCLFGFSIQVEVLEETFEIIHYKQKYFCLTL